MRVLRQTITLLLMLVSCWGLGAQDIHFSLFDMSPLTLNPALTGAYSGTARIGGIIRDQWQSQLTWNGYRTYSIYLDAPIIRGFGKRDWIGVGLMTVTDEVGPANLKLNNSTLSLSYHLSMDKKGNNILTLGASYGNPTRSVDLSSTNQSLLFEDEILDAFNNGSNVPFGQTSQDRSGGGSGGNQNNGTETDWANISAGLLYKSRLDERESLEIGVALLNLLSPDVRTLVRGSGTGGGGSNREFEQPSRFNAHLIYERPLNEKLSLKPKVMFSRMAGTSETNLQGWLGYQLNDQFKLLGGLGYRLGSSSQVLLGLETGDLRVGFSWDLQVNNLAFDRPGDERPPSGNNQNAPYASALGIRYPMSFELGAYYVLKVYKKPEVDPAILCPKF